MSVSGSCRIANKSNIWLQISSHFSFLWKVITSWCWSAPRTPGQLFRTFYHSSQVPPYIGPVPSAGWSLTGVRQSVSIHHYLIWTIKRALIKLTPYWHSLFSALNWYTQRVGHCLQLHHIIHAYIWLTVLYFQFYFERNWRCKTLAFTFSVYPGL